MRRTISTLMVLGVISGCSGSQKSSAPAGDTQAPQVVITAPASVEGGQTVALSVTVTDNISTGLTPTLSCIGNGTLTGTMLATTVVTADTTVTCTATATDAAGNVGTGNATILVKATTARLSVGEGQASLLQGQAGLLVAANLPLGCSDDLII